MQSRLRKSRTHTSQQSASGCQKLSPTRPSISKKKSGKLRKSEAQNVPPTPKQSSSVPQKKSGKHSKNVAQKAAAKRVQTDSHKGPLRGPTHILQKLPWSDQKTPPRKLCIVCKKKGQRLLSHFFCPKCPDQPAYCRVRNCFLQHHAKMGVKYLKTVLKVRAT